MNYPALWQPMKTGCIFEVHIFSAFGELNIRFVVVKPLSAKLTKWPNTLKQFVGNLPTNCLSVFGHFVGLALKGLNFPR